MKKWYLLLVVLLILPTVSATIVLEGPQKETFNWGDKLILRGYISRPKNTAGDLKFTLNCGEDSSPYPTESNIKIYADSQYTLDKELPIPYLTGNCHITTTLIVPEDPGEQTNSKEFIITDELDSTITIDNNLVQLGKQVKISGSIFKKDGTNINGIATLYLKKGEEKYLESFIEIVNSKFEYILDTSSKSAGTYNIEIHASDIFGNKNIFSDLTITLTSEIVVTAKSSDLDALPGDTIKISGEAVDISQEYVRRADVLITIGEKEFLTTLSRGDFSEKITIPKNLKSGKQNIHIIVEDDQGNRGETDLQIEVKPIQTNLDISILKESYNPSSDIKITPILKDQAGDSIIQDISIEISNPKGKLEFNEVKKTNEEVTYTLGQYSLPGTWTIKAISSDLSYEKTFLVNEIFLLHFELNNQILSVINRGNVKYTLPLKVQLKGPQKINIVKKLNLYPKETSEIDLGIGIPTGTYTVLVQDKEFKDINIIGKKQPFSYDFIYYLFIILIVLAFFYWLSKKVFKKKRKRKPKEKKEKPKEEFKEKYKKEFLDRMLKKVSERESKTTKELRFKFKPKKKVSHEAGYIQIPVPKEPTITNILQRSSETPSWRILKKKGLTQPTGKQTEKKGLFSMFD